MSRRLFGLIAIGILAFGLLCVGVRFSQERKNVMFSVTGSPGMREMQTLPYSGKMAGESAPMAASSFMAADMVLPQPATGGKLFVQDTSLSLLVRNPVEAEQRIRQVTSELGGFLVSSNLNQPEEGTTGFITVRVPTEKLEEALQKFKEPAERVVSQTISGRDVTEEYQDIEANITLLNTTQERLEGLLNNTSDVSTLMQLQQQILSIQQQKDSLVGRQRYLEESAKTTVVTIHLASDELALPYAPAQPWKPEAIFKQAVRSLVGTLRGVASLAIWGAVYLPILIPVVLVLWWVLRKLRV